MLDRGATGMAHFGVRRPVSSLSAHAVHDQGSYAGWALVRNRHIAHCSLDGQVSSDQLHGNTKLAAGHRACSAQPSFMWLGQAQVWRS